MNAAETQRLLRMMREQRDEALQELAANPKEHSADGRNADPWENHYSLGMGARTERHARELEAKIKAARVPFSGFDKNLNLKVDSAPHQRQLMKVVLGPNAVNRDSYYG